jgi:type III secretory pathway component EscU
MIYLILVIVIITLIKTIMLPTQTKLDVVLSYPTIHFKNNRINSKQNLQNFN